VITIYLQPRNDFLDPAFGSGGIVTTDFAGYDDFGYGAALQPDGKILVSGSVHNGLDSDFGLARYNSDGSLDITFGSDGKVTTDVSSCCLVNINTASVELLEMLPGIGPITAQWIVDYRNANGSFQKIEDIVNVPGIGPGTFDRIKDLITVGNDYGLGVALQPDGRIIVVGGSNNDFALARYKGDGSPDTTFGTDGRVLTDVGENYGTGISVTLQPDGKIIAAGFGGTVINFVLVRYNSDGSLDATFGDNGIVITHISGEDFGRVLALQPDGKIIVAGQSWVQGKGYNFTLVRYNSDGSLDTSFGVNGVVSTDFEDSFEDNISAILLPSDGKIIAAGWSDADGIFNFAMARYHSDGSPDPTFGLDGKVSTPFPFNDAYGNAAALQPDGGIVVAGQYFMPDVGYTFALARYLPDGSLDMGFGMDGRITTEFGSGDSQAYAVLLQSDGKIVAAGHSFTGASFDFALARYQVGGSPSPMKVTIDIKPGSRTNHVNPQSGGRIHVAILSTPEFDALTMIDRTTIRFGRTGEEESLRACREKGRDVNHDGLKDLVCVFSIRGSGFQQGDEIGILTAHAIDSVALVGQDSIRVVREEDD
jgi:competence ComEA-like helix-hairpin-helix protein